jgi:gliding motility-associated-like protein
VGTLTSTKNPGSIFAQGKTTVTYSATDASGNTSTCSFVVNVMDSTPPILVDCPANIVLTTDACRAPVEWSAPKSNDCDLSAINGSHNPGDLFPIGTTRVTYKASDILGNVSTCGFDVTVKNSSAPVISNCPVNIHLEANTHGNASATWIEPTVTAQCDEVTLTNSHRPGDVFELGTTEVAYTVTDDSGNRSYCRFNVVVSEPRIKIDVSRVITPDGNGVNDEWILTNIDQFRDNEVMIFDRWGNVIFRARAYDNQEVVWRGSNGAGGSVPTGTYFYSIIINSESSRIERKGFIELIR